MDWILRRPLGLIRPTEQTCLHARADLWLLWVTFLSSSRRPLWFQSVPCRSESHQMAANTSRRVSNYHPFALLLSAAEPIILTKSLSKSTWSPHRNKNIRPTLECIAGLCASLRYLGTSEFSPAHRLLTFCRIQMCSQCWFSLFSDSESHRVPLFCELFHHPVIYKFWESLTWSPRFRWLEHHSKGLERTD